MEKDSAASGWVTTCVISKWSIPKDSDNSNNMVIFLISPPKCMYLLEFTALFSSYYRHIMRV